MESLIKTDKKLISSFVPYRRRASGEYEYFLQMRDKHAPVHPSVFSLFGGGIDEGENVEEAFMRETQEELQYVPTKPHFFAVFENAYRKFNVFVEEVGADFESQVTVCEGEYGSFLSMEEIEHSTNVSSIAMLVVEDVDIYLSKQQ